MAVSDTGAFVVIVAGIVVKFGLGGLALVGIMAGILLLLMGITGLGTAIKYIPRPVTIGFTTLGEWVAHRPSPVRSVVSLAEIHNESERLARSGLVVRDGSLLRECAFAPPWTAHSSLVPSNWLGASRFRMMFGSHRVRADWLLSDLDVLQPVMQRPYGGWDSAASRGWNWNSWFDNWRKELHARGSEVIPWSEAVAPVDALIAFQRDNHTQIPLMRQSTGDGSLRRGILDG